jgi:hypothetical protein
MQRDLQNLIKSKTLKIDCIKKVNTSCQQRFCVMRAVWFIGKFELLLNCTKHPIYSPKSRTPQQPQHVIGNSGRHNPKK